MRKLVFIALALFGCADGFLCGTPLPSNPDAIRACARPHEVCVCASNSCATKVALSGSADACESGLRYVERSFAAGRVAGICVSLADARRASPENPSGLLCSAEPLADGGADDLQAGHDGASVEDQSVPTDLNGDLEVPRD